MAMQVLDSHLRCPRDGKLMMLDVGQEDSDEGLMRAVHTCWHCGYWEIDKAWSRPLRTDGPSILERIRDRLRGEKVELVYDRTPVTVEEALREAEEQMP